MLNLKNSPTSVGLAGMAFTEKRAIFGIVGKTTHSFQEIDHVTMSGTIKNFLFLPLFGYSEEVVGVLELINKRGELDLVEIEKLEVFQRSIGLMIRHIEEINTTLAASFSLKKIMHCLKKM